MRAAVAVLAKAPVPGYAKTRLIPALGPDGAALLQARLIRRALETALESGFGPVTLWCAPDTGHPAFREAADALGIALAAQPDADLGERMLAAFQHAAPLVLVGTDCPCLGPGDLREAADALRAGADVAIAPAEDGGYGLIAAQGPFPGLFEGVPWSTAEVARETRARAETAGLALAELRPIWDVDTPEDYGRLLSAGLLPGLPAPLQVTFRQEAARSRHPHGRTGP